MGRTRRFYRFNRLSATVEAVASAVSSPIVVFGAFVIFGVIGFIGSPSVFAAQYKTANFVVEADSPELAREIGDSAEQYRKTLAVEWLGAELPNWFAPCVVSVAEGPELGAGGETVFTFSNGEVYDWKMTIQGSEARLLDSVLPHEVTHTVLASYLRAPAPRWLDEGIATSVEADVERSRYRRMLTSFLHAKKGIAFNDMVAAAEYPDDLMPFYSQSFSVCEYLILVGGRRRLVEFAKFGCETRDWNEALRRYYDCDSLGALQLEWVAWVAEWDAAGMPENLPATRGLGAFDESALAWSGREVGTNGADGSNGINGANGRLEDARPLTRGQSNERENRGKVRWFETSKSDSNGKSARTSRTNRNAQASQTSQANRNAQTSQTSRTNRNAQTSRATIPSALFADGAGSATRRR